MISYTLRILLAASVLSLWLSPVAPAFAQDADAAGVDEPPPSLSAPSLIPAEMPQDSGKGAVAASVAATAAADKDGKKKDEVLCPDPDIMKRSVPGDLSGVQADIERLNLCVERVKLLKQLDDVIIQRKKALEKLTSPAAAANGINTGLGVSSIPPLPVSALPPLKTPSNLKNFKPGGMIVQGAAGSPFDRAAAGPSDWQVRKIWGQGAGMRAQIIDASAGGTIMNVVKGDPLPDGAVVETVSVKGVAISRNGKISDLSWEQISDNSNGSNAKVIP